MPRNNIRTIRATYYGQYLLDSRSHLFLHQKINVHTSRTHIPKSDLHRLQRGTQTYRDGTGAEQRRSIMCISYRHAVIRKQYVTKVDEIRLGWKSNNKIIREPKLLPERKKNDTNSHLKSSGQA